MKHKNCECYVCKFGQAAANKFEADAIKKYGFYIHFVPNDCGCPHHMNIHTHGILEVFKHKDLQICFPLPQQVALETLHNVVHYIKDGKTFVSGKKYSGIIRNYNIEFIDAIECGREVLRLLVPNKEGTYAGEFGLQLTMLDNS